MKAHVTMKAEGIVAGKGEVGQATIKVTGQDATMRHEPPETIHPKAQASLERSIRNAATKGLESIRYKGIEVPLIDIGLAQKMVKDGKLHKDLVFGMWAYFDNPVAADYASTPNYFQADLSNNEMHNYADKILKDIVFNDDDVNDSLESVGATLNNHQRKWVVNYIVKGLGAKRTETIREAQESLDEAEKSLDLQNSFGNQAEVHNQAMRANVWNPNKEQFHAEQAQKAAAAAIQTSNKTGRLLKQAEQKREKADKIKLVEQQMAQLMAMMQELKDDE